MNRIFHGEWVYETCIRALEVFPLAFPPTHPTFPPGFSHMDNSHPENYSPASPPHNDLRYNTFIILLLRIIKCLLGLLVYGMCIQGVQNRLSDVPGQLKIISGK